MRFLAHAESRFLVDGADDPDQVLAWLDGAGPASITATSFGHQQLVVECRERALIVGTERAFDVAHGDLPVKGTWSPGAWPMRACAGTSGDDIVEPPEPTPIRPLATNARDQSPAPYVPEPGRGGFHPIQRLLGLLVDVRCEAHAAKLVSSKRERDASFDEIAALADQAMQLVERYAKPAPTAQLREVTARAR